LASYLKNNQVIKIKTNHQKVPKEDHFVSYVFGVVDIVEEE
jgi:hypothetical protein